MQRVAAACLARKQSLVFSCLPPLAVEASFTYVPVLTGNVSLECLLIIAVLMSRQQEFCHRRTETVL